MSLSSLFPCCSRGHTRNQSDTQLFVDFSFLERRKKNCVCVYVRSLWFKNKLPWPKLVGWVMLGQGEEVSFKTLHLLSCADWHCWCFKAKVGTAVQSYFWFYLKCGHFGTDIFLGGQTTAYSRPLSYLFQLLSYFFFLSLLFFGRPQTRWLLLWNNLW